MAASVDGTVPRSGLLAWAEWYVDMGVTDAVDGPMALTAPTASTAPTIAPVAPSLFKDDNDARAIAARCGSVAELEQALRRFDGCALSATASHLCFADGEPTADVMLVGEKPGAEEDRLGKPFVGPSGRLLDKMLSEIGLDRRQVYITNLIYWRPPGNREPTTAEIAACLPFLERQIELVRPRVIVSLGGLAARVLLDLKEGVTRLRGRRFAYAAADGARTPLIVMLHPAYLLRNALQKRFAWRDLLTLRAELRRLRQAS